MKKFLEININSKQYILIDTYEYKKDTLFHFGALSLDDEVFCKKVNEGYVPIIDEFEISIIKNKFGLINIPYYYDVTNYFELIRGIISQFKLRPAQNKIYRLTDRTPLSAEEANKIRKEQIDNFKMIKEKYNLNIKLEDIIHIIGKVKLFKGDKLDRHNRILGYYRPATDSIVYRKDMIEKDTIVEKDTRLHEFIHAMTERGLFLYLFFNGLMEGQTENLSQSMYNDNTSTKESYNHKSEEFTMHYNFSQSTSYKNLVTLVQQMEYAIGQKSYESIIKGNMSFEHNFSKEYGLPLMVFMAYRMQRLFIEEYSIIRGLSKIIGRQFDVAGYLKKTQNVLLENVFDKDFTKVENLEDAKRFLEKLRNFETTRTKIRIYDYDKREGTKDTSFKEYYYKKFEEISRLLEGKGISREHINAELEQYQYEEQEFKPKFSREKELRLIKSDVIRLLGNKVIDNNMIDMSDCYVKVFRMSNENAYNFFIVKKGTNKGYWLQEDYFSGKTQKIFENMPETLKNARNGNLTDIIKTLKDRGFEEIDIEIESEELQGGIIHHLEREVKRNEDGIYRFVEEDPEYANYLQTKNQHIIDILHNQYGKEYSPTTERKKHKEKKEEQEEKSMLNMLRRGVSIATISIESIIKNALGNQNIGSEEVRKVDEIELKQQEHREHDEKHKREGVDK